MGRIAYTETGEICGAPARSLIRSNVATEKSDMVIDPSAILTKEDMEKERTPDELSLWWEKKNREFANSKEGHHYAC